MKVLKKVALIIMSVLILVAIFPEMTVKAATVGFVYYEGGAGTGLQYVPGSGATKYRSVISLKFIYTTPSGQPEPPCTEYLGAMDYDSPEAAEAGVNYLIQAYLDSLNNIEGSSGGHWNIASGQTVTIVKYTKSRSESTRHYGLEVFAGYVPVTKSGTEITISDVQASMTAGKQSQKSMGVYKVGGQDDTKPMYGTGGGASHLAPTIISWSSDDIDLFFSTFGSCFPGLTKEAYMASITGAASTVNVPFVVATVAMSTGSSGGIASLIRGNMNPYAITASQADNFFRSRASGGDSLISGLLAGGSPNLPLSTSAPIYSKYVYPIAGAIPIDADFIFGVESTPKEASTKWEDPDDTRKGSFKINVMAASPTAIEPNAEYKIRITATHVNAMYDGPFCVATPLAIEEKPVKGSDLVKEKPAFVKIDVTGGSPGDPSPDVLNKGVLKFNVTIIGGPEPKEAQFDMSISDEEAKGSGIDGYNYVGWKNSEAEDPKEDPNEVELEPWAHHSAAEPMINGTLGASEYNNEDWETGTGIPSTENVYVLAGGETAVSDLAGYFVIHSNTFYQEVSTDAQGENEPGIEPADPSVKREIMLTCSVQNTWGWNNTLCHRQAVGYSADGGCDSGDRGGGTPFNCPGGNVVTHSGSHSSPHSGSWNSTSNHCAGSHTYGSQNDVAAYAGCTYHGTAWTQGSGNKHYDHHDSCGQLDGCKQDVPEIGPPTASDSHCGSNIASSCTPETIHHNCKWNLTVYDGDRHDEVNVSNADAPIDLPDSFTITANGGYLKDGLGIFTISGAGQEWIDRVISIDVPCSTCNQARVKGSVTWTNVANQYFHLSGSYEIWQDALYENVHAWDCPHYTNKWNGYNSGTSKEEKTLSPSNGTEMLCNGYSYGTGSACDEYENCYHLKEHNYTLKYLESIDFYVFRTVTDAHVAAMRGSEISDVNNVTRSGYDKMNGTFGAPIDEQAVGESATAPESIGYLWRCINTQYGSYVNGEGLETANGEYNGRILFEIWKEPEAGASGALSYEFNTNFCLGNAEIKAILLQDHKFGNDPTIKAQLHPTESLESIPETMPNRGDNLDRYNHEHVTSKERGKGKGAEYAGKDGDCLNESWSAGANWEANDDTEKQEYRDIVIAEQNAIVNYWQGKNKDDNYHANIISDSLIYGGKTMTTQVVGEYYTVDEGIPLFNYLGGTIGRTEIDDDEEGPIYRNHHSTVGSGKMELANFILNYHAPTAPMMNDGAHYGYFGFGGVGDGGDVAIPDTLTGKCVEGTIYEIENGNKGSWVPGADVIDAYRRKLGSKASYPTSDKMSGITEFQSYLPNQPSPGGDSFAGYWNDHQYPAHVSETVMGRCNTSFGQSLEWEDLSDFQFDGTNSGTLNQQQYGQSLLMHNLPLVDWTPNGVWPTVDLSNAYGWLLEIESEFEPVLAKLNENGVYDRHKTIVDTGMSMSLPETIRIYDPISVENSHNIGNQYGAWSGDPVLTPDYSDYDQRASSINKAKNDFAAIGNYVCTNTYLWTWIAPFGDFSSVGGSGGEGSDITTAEVYRNQGNKGYTDEMYIGTWTKTLKFDYPFIGKAKHNEKVSQTYYIDELDNVYGNGNSEYMESAYGPDTLQNFYTSIENPVFKFGNAVGCLNTVNLTEGKSMPVTITAYAINDGIQESSNSCNYGESVNANGSNVDKWCNAASTIEPIDLVGQIGNLAILDTTDFRFSTYFKQPIEGSWLIDGIVLNTNEKEPIHILAQPKDIVFQDAAPLKYRHSTLGVTNMALSKLSYGKGMGGEFGLLPLTPAYITVPEFKTDALRLGYKVYASIETIGNYTAAHKPGVKYPTNYDQAQDPSMDTRDEYMEITSEYYLYDYDDGKFYGIDLWSGPEGAKQCIYSGGDRKVHPQLNSEPLYINMDEEFYRRNVSNLEENVSRNAFNNVSTDNKVYTAIMSGLEFIGYTGHIKLDTMDLTYCGSDAVQGIEGYNDAGDQCYTGAFDTSQRWHFTTGLTSTTTPTMPIYQDGRVLTATQVENAYKDLRDKHPHSVIVEFQNYVAAGSVWTLKYKGSLMNSDTIKFYSNPDDCPYEEKGHIETQYKDVTVYNPNTGTQYGSQKIDKDSTPLVAYEAYKSNSEDRTVAGTH